MAVWAKLIITFIVIQGLLCQEAGRSDADDPTESEETDKPTIPARITTDSQQILVSLGEQIRLPCQVENLEASGGVVVWKKVRRGKESPLTNDQKKVMTSPNLQLDFSPDKTKFDLVIAKARNTDSGDYICLVMQTEQVEIKHTVTITFPPTVDIIPNEPVETDKNTQLEVTCGTRGFPVPTVKWTLTDAHGTVKELPHFFNQSKIHIESLTRADAGTYVCVADNGVGSPSNGSLRVVVRYKPELIEGSKLVLSHILGEAKLRCSFSAYPLDGKLASWHRLEASSDSPDDIQKTEVVDDDRHRVQTDATDTTITTVLTISAVKEEDFRKYICMGTTNAGEESHEVELSGLAHPENIHALPQERKDKEPLKYGVRMRVKSFSPVKEYLIIYREINETHEGESKNVTIVEDGKDFQTEAGDVKVYEKTYVFDNLRPLTNYTIKMMAQNDYGWSKETDLHKFWMDDARNGAASAQGGRGSASRSCQNIYHPLALISVVLVLFTSWRTSSSPLA